jgi:hypothetical protein
MSEAARILQEDEQEFTEPEQVPVLDDFDAEYLMRRIREADEQYERFEAWYTHMMQKAKEARDRTVEWAERNLRTYFETAELPKKQTKTQQSYQLPSGTLILKKQEPKYDTDDEKLVPWLKANQKTDLIKVKEEANWKELKKQLQNAPDGLSMVTEDGEIVPGITVTPREDKFTVTLK